MFEKSFRSLSWNEKRKCEGFLKVESRGFYGMCM